MRLSDTDQYKSKYSIGAALNRTALIFIFSDFKMFQPPT